FPEVDEENIPEQCILAVSRIQSEAEVSDEQPATRARTGKVAKSTKSSLEADPSASQPKPKGKAKATSQDTGKSKESKRTSKAKAAPNPITRSNDAGTSSGTGLFTHYSSTWDHS
ncbi:hypothetical protein BDN72DRAFT_907559, partial [Pluteus cervinus]